jgi:hypothetical protein
MLFLKFTDRICFSSKHTNPSFRNGRVPLIFLKMQDVRLPNRQARPSFSEQGNGYRTSLQVAFLLWAFLAIKSVNGSCKTGLFLSFLIVLN